MAMKIVVSPEEIFILNVVFVQKVVLKYEKSSFLYSIAIGKPTNQNSSGLLRKWLLKKEQNIYCRPQLRDTVTVCCTSLLYKEMDGASV